MRPSFSNEFGGSFILIEPGVNGDLEIYEPYFIGARPVTQVEWSSVMDSNPSRFTDGWSAGLRPVEHLQQVFGYRNAFNFPRRVFIPSVHEVADFEKGITDQDIKSRLSLQADQFVKFCRSLGKLS